MAPVLMRVRVGNTCVLFGPVVGRRYRDPLSQSHFLHQKKKSQPLQGDAAATDRFLAVVQGSADLFWLLTPEGSMQETCSSWHTFTAQRESDCLGRGWLNALYPADQPQMEEALLQSAVSGHAAEIECHIRRSDGAYRLVRVRVLPVRTAGGNLREIVVCGNDITAEQMSEAQIQLALKAAGVGMWDANLVTNQLLATDQWKALVGLPPDAPVTYECFLTAIHPDDREKVDRLKTRALVERKDYQTEFRTIWPDGSLHWLTGRARGIYDVDGQPVHFMGAIVDITELKQVEERITAILESITDAFVHIDTEWRYTYVNRQMEEIIGRSRAEVLGQRLWDVMPDFLGTPFEHHVRAAMATQQVMQFEAFYPTTQRWIGIHVYPTPDGLSIYVQNITERKHMEEALRESEARFCRLVESNIIGIVVFDLEGNIREANDAFLALVGYSQEDLAAGQVRWTTITPPEYQALTAWAIQEVLATGVAQLYEKEYVTKDGKRVPVLIGCIFFRQEGSAQLLIGFVLDLTARKELERQKDLFLGMTSHELKTPLAALRGTLQLIQRHLKRVVTTTHEVSPEWSAFGQNLTKKLKDSVRQIDVQTRLINDLLDISRITAKTLKLSLHRCDLGSIVRETVEDLRVTAPERSLLLELPEHPAVIVLADPGRISQVVTNYVTNALRYSSPDQPVSIGLTPQGDDACVWVRDRGPGLSEEAQTQIWQRFHQVKGIPVQSGSGIGLGLGLYICQTLIAQHQGEVGVESTPGEGSTFWFTLPMVK